MATVLAERTVENAASTAGRLESIDLLRGVVMVLMAIDHVRVYFTIARFDPVSWADSTPEYFVTRWITHFVAPTFVLLAGTAAFLYGRRSEAALPRFLWTRGLWLVAVEMTFVHFGWTYDLNFGVMAAQVIWAIGWSMVALSFLVRLGPVATGAIGLGIVALHNLADPLVPSDFGSLGPLWVLLHEGGVIPLGPGAMILAFYPVLPWIGVIAAGYGFGQVFLWDGERRARVLPIVGLGMVALFFVLRGAQVYGDADGWADRGDLARTAMDFMAVTKYPPSFLFILATLGPVVAALPLLERAKGRAAAFFVTLGRVPLFYYVVHLILIHGLAIVFANLSGFTGLRVVSIPQFTFPEGYGWDLPVVYLVTAGVVLLLYPFCAWFADLKRRRRDWWLSYL
ncbi:MAG TPA: heparan-alpha-glucosaminide N-acetyltransferase domain-containing protein [Candidatus Thermoplasmatota archaeon]|nr:heparan-alpha-glucosaminide N-acetyltransferase domain-containing protein [Candidatus Thermoplasmatota archaeon]